MKILGIVLFSMIEEMVIETLAKGSVTTSIVCLKCHLSIFDREFVVDLVCLTLSGMDVILGMYWLKFNYVHINCYKKSLWFLTPDQEGELVLIF